VSRHCFLLLNLFYSATNYTRDTFRYNYSRGRRARRYGYTPTWNAYDEPQSHKAAPAVTITATQNPWQGLSLLHVLVQNEALQLLKDSIQLGADPNVCSLPKAQETGGHPLFYFAVMHW
jgi:hypothetical protein